MLRVEVHNGSERAITNVYVWADARGVRGHYAAGVPVEDAQARRMANVPRGGDLFWQLRVVRPGQHAFFTQLTHLSPQPVAARADADITAFAEFTDADGGWWRCDEDGWVTRQQRGEPSPGAAGRGGGRRGPFPSQAPPSRAGGRGPPARGPALGVGCAGGAGGDRGAAKRVRPWEVPGAEHDPARCPRGGP